MTAQYWPGVQGKLKKKNLELSIGRVFIEEFGRKVGYKLDQENEWDLDQRRQRTHGDGVQKSFPGDSGFARVENSHLGNFRMSKTCGRAHLAFPSETVSVRDLCGSQKIHFYSLKLF